MRFLRSLSALVLCCAAGAALAATVPPPPATPAGDTVDVIQGTKVADPYRWLEDPADPKVQAWSDAQNARTRAYLDALPEADAIKSKLTQLITATSPSYSELEARGDLVFAMYSDPAKQQPMLVTLDTKADPDSRKMVLDPNALDARGLTSIDWQRRRDAACL
jgi:prolyl oligopeptidase